MAGGNLESNTINKIIPTSIENQKGSNLASNSNFSIVDNQSGLTDINGQNLAANNQPRINLMLNPNFTSFSEASGLPLYWKDSLKRCDRNFSCKVNATDGWYDRQSFQLSTTNNTNNTWSLLKVMK